MNHKPLAVDLMGNPVLKSSWSAETLAIWLRDRCKCVYCGRDMLASYDVAYHCASIDHLLPKFEYRQFENTEWNQVLACRGCNCIKRDWDPNTQANGATIYAVGSEISDEVPSKLIDRAKDHIQRIRAEREQRFAREKELILSAIGENGKIAVAGK